MGMNREEIARRLQERFDREAQWKVNQKHGFNLDAAEIEKMADVVFNGEATAARLPAKHGVFVHRDPSTHSLRISRTAYACVVVPDTGFMSAENMVRRQTGIWDPAVSFLLKSDPTRLRLMGINHEIGHAGDSERWTDDEINRNERLSDAFAVLSDMKRTKCDLGLARDLMRIRVFGALIKGDIEHLTLRAVEQAVHMAVKMRKEKTLYNASDSQLLQAAEECLDIAMNDEEKKSLEDWCPQFAKKIKMLPFFEQMRHIRAVAAAPDKHHSAVVKLCKRAIDIVDEADPEEEWVVDYWSPRPKRSGPTPPRDGNRRIRQPHTRFNDDLKAVLKERGGTPERDFAIRRHALECANQMFRVARNTIEVMKLDNGPDRADRLKEAKRRFSVLQNLVADLHARVYHQNKALSERETIDTSIDHIATEEADRLEREVQTFIVRPSLREAEVYERTSDATPIVDTAESLAQATRKKTKTVVDSRLGDLEESARATRDDGPDVPGNADRRDDKVAPPVRAVADPQLSL